MRRALLLHSPPGMRVAGTASRARSRTDSPRRDRFAAALQDARRRERRTSPAEAPVLLDPKANGRTLGTRRIASDRRDEALDGRREGFREELPKPPGQAVLVPAPASAAEAAPSAELRALVRALPPAIEAARVRAGEPLALAFGSALSVELTAAPEGVEIVVRTGATLSRAARAELPHLVEALRRRGVSVAGVEVLPGAHHAPAGASDALTPHPALR